MKILIAPNAFKGTITAEEAAVIIRKAIYSVQSDIDFKLCPIADGGDGTSHLLAKALHLPIINMMALDALGRPVDGFFALDRSSATALLDVSSVSGFSLLKQEEQDPSCTCTYGTGEMVKAAIDMGATHIELGLGGTASIDMGIGILRALGFLFLDQYGREIPMFSPKFLSKIKHIQRPIKKLNIHFTLLCDVWNPFFGLNGAVPIFGPQKGLNEKLIEEFVTSAEDFYHLLKNKSIYELEDHPGFGAAGGIALGLSAFFPTEVVNGSHHFFDKVQILKQIEWADLIITGEGMYDMQSAAGKGSYQLMNLAKNNRKKVCLITGGNDPGEGFDDIIYLPPLASKKDRVRAKEVLFERVIEFFNGLGSLD